MNVIRFPSDNPVISGFQFFIVLTIAMFAVYLIYETLVLDWLNGSYCVEHAIVLWIVGLLLLAHGIVFAIAEVKDAL